MLERLHRYKLLLKKFWWVLIFTASVGLFVKAVLALNKPPDYVSTAQMSLTGRIDTPEGNRYREELTGFFNTQLYLMQSPLVQEKAAQRVQTLHPELMPENAGQVSLKAEMIAATTVFRLEAAARDPKYAQAYLDAVMQEYLDFRRSQRDNTTDGTLWAITQQLETSQKELAKSEQELLDFQKTNNMVFIQEQADNTGKYLVSLTNEINAMKAQADLLNLLDVDQSLEIQKNPAKSSTNNGNSKEGGDGKQDNGEKRIDPLTPEGRYLEIKQNIQMLKARKADFAKDLKPKHPKMIHFDEEILQLERMSQVLKEETREQMKSRREAMKLAIQNLEATFAETRKKSLELNELVTEFSQLKNRLEQKKSLNDRLLMSVENVKVSSKVEQENVAILSPASPAYEMRGNLKKDLLMGAGMGLVFGAGILFLIGKLDDRITCLAELEQAFSEPIRGQIPKVDVDKGQEKNVPLMPGGKVGGAFSESFLNIVSSLKFMVNGALSDRFRTLPANADDGPKERVPLLQPGDERHIFAESYRNIRSSLVYMGDGSEVTKLIMVTSSIPGEGKSTVASNLAATIAFAGSKTLLVDSDLRRGVAHEIFQLSNDRGFSDVLQGGVKWADAVQKTFVPHLSVLTRGKTPTQPGELMLGSITDQFLRDIRQDYDYVIIDSAPVLATDDTPSLAPRVDGVLFVCRSMYSTVGAMTKALDLLYDRQVNVLGFVFNSVSQDEPGYGHYYNYKEYYSRPEKAKA